jgi:hypothetical protein
MGLIGQNWTFVYGDFFFGKKSHSMPPPPGRQPFAVEILREFSTTEFVGKLFARVGSSWLPSTRGGLSNYLWYEPYQKSKGPLYFEMEGSGIWQVQNLREESDDSGPYMAVALKFAKPKG